MEVLKTIPCYSIPDWMFYAWFVLSVLLFVFLLRSSCKFRITKGQRLVFILFVVFVVSTIVLVTTSFYRFHHNEYIVKLKNVTVEELMEDYEIVEKKNHEIFRIREK